MRGEFLDNPAYPPEADCLICDLPIVDHYPPTPVCRHLRTLVKHYSLYIIFGGNSL